MNPRLQPETKEVALFVTCLVDLFRPNVAMAAIRLLENAACEVVVPKLQTCCGQPAYNSGDAESARALARQMIAVFEKYSRIVAPSGSCAGMMKHHYPKLWAPGSEWNRRAQALAEKTFELSDYLAKFAPEDAIDARYEGSACYHDSCAGLRELGIKEQPRALLRRVRGLEMKPLPEDERCCGFGGLFCVKNPEVSDAMTRRKTDNIATSGADTVLAGDMGCLLNIAGKLSRERRAVKVWHFAEVLAGMTAGPAIGDYRDESAIGEKNH
jgi:L-lactate dehydrogenase complex protein LldE